MESNIIVGYDGSPGALDALVLGGLLGRLTGRPLLLAAFYRDEPAVPPRADQDRELIARAWARRALDQAPVGAETERRTLHGRSPAAALSMLAEERDAAAIVVGSAHHAGHRIAIAGNRARSWLQDDIDSSLAQLGAQSAVDDEFTKLKAELDAGQPAAQIAVADDPAAS